MDCGEVLFLLSFLMNLYQSINGFGNTIVVDLDDVLITDIGISGFIACIKICTAISDSVNVVIALLISKLNKLNSALSYINTSLRLK